jgi:hypothetical protein
MHASLYVLQQNETGQSIQLLQLLKVLAWRRQAEIDREAADWDVVLGHVVRINDASTNTDDDVAPGCVANDSANGTSLNIRRGNPLPAVSLEEVCQTAENATRVSKNAG